MHGLINRSIQCFLRDTYGGEAWLQVARKASLDPQGFEAMLTYDDAVTTRMVNAMADFLEKPAEGVLEDVGTYLVTHQNTHAIRRLLRFGGETYHEFLASLDGLPDRAALAVPDLEFPQLDLRDHEPGHYTLHVTDADPGFAYVLMGVLRALADDYGALVMLEVAGGSGPGRILELWLADQAFAEGNAFTLGAASEKESA